MVFRTAARALGIGMVLSLSCSAVSADDWPQWMGPQRDNVWREDGLLEKFPAGGPKVLWSTPVAGGYSGPAVSGGKVCITDYVTADNVKVDNFDRREFSGTERIHCLDEATGKVLWTHEYPVKYSISYPAGPRCTPVMHEGLVYALGAEGHLFCLSTDSGKVVWSHDLKKEYSTTAPLWGYAAHPLIDGDNLLTLAGGEGTHIVALNRLTGQEVWRSTSSGAQGQGYCPPTIINHGGARQLIMYKPDAVVSLDPATGKQYWSLPYEASNGSIIMSPVLSGNYLYAAGYSNKSLMMELDPARPAAREVWRDKSNIICPVNVQPFLDKEVLYGFDQKGVLRALTIPDGKRLWETSDAIGKRPAGSETAFIVRQGSRYVLFNELGELLLAELTAEGYREIDRAKVIEPSNFAFGREVVWSMPAFANRHVYLRNDNQIICVDFAAAK
ncbi:MAG: PQQ-like beta-propeller repeat protein [Planctomyces sp.]|jgi:outer membrane protein assembly factor BamB|nr:PQQ-like beta-propeller repeat protein [Planctomyces sp.]